MAIRLNYKKLIKFCLITACFIALIVADAFIPIKYLSSYFGLAVQDVATCNDGACVHFIDVGYGDCTFMRLPDGKTVLIDGGDGSFKNNLAITSLITAHGVNKIDYLFCTSVLAKRCGGLAEIVNEYKVDNAFYPYCIKPSVNSSYKKFMSALKNSGATLKYLHAGVGFESEEYGYLLRVLSPIDHENPMSEYTDLNSQYSTKNANRASGIIYFSYGGVNLLLCGDADKFRLENLCESYLLGAFSNVNVFGEIQLENCKIIKVANGGKSQSFSPTVFDFIKPETAIVSYGYDYYNYPSASLLSYAPNLKGVYLTNGANVNLTIAGGGYTVSRKEK